MSASMPASMIVHGTCASRQSSIPASMHPQWDLCNRAVKHGGTPCEDTGLLVMANRGLQVNPDLATGTFCLLQPVHMELAACTPLAAAMLTCGSCCDTHEQCTLQLACPQCCAPLRPASEPSLLDSIARGGGALEQGFPAWSCMCGARCSLFWGVPTCTGPCRWNEGDMGVAWRGRSGHGDGVHVLTGPVWVCGAQPGDVLQVGQVA